MRLWDYRLLPYLPNSQLLAQKRECDVIWKDIYRGKKTNHILINYIWQYTLGDFLNYYDLLQKEFNNRGFSFKNRANSVDFAVFSPFKFHHNQEYLTICYMNLKEKYLRGQKDFTEEVWTNLDQFYKNEMMNA